MLLLDLEYCLRGLSLWRCHHAMRFFVGRGLVNSSPVGFPLLSVRALQLSMSFTGRHTS